LQLANQLLLPFHGYPSFGKSSSFDLKMGRFGCELFLVSRHN